MSEGGSKVQKPLPPATGSRAFSRRDFIRVATTSALAVGTVGVGALLFDRVPRVRSAALAIIRDHRVARPSGAVQMAIARGADPAVNVRRALEAMGGISAFVTAGDRVVIKPNVGWNRLPEQAANTNPDVVAEVVRLVVAAGASKVWVMDNPVNTPERCFARSGIEEAAKRAGAKVVLPDKLAFRSVEVAGGLLRDAQVLWPLVEADKVINLPIAKHHGLSGVTLAMKNWYGVLGGHRVRLHQEIHRSIIDLAAMVRPTLSILDATRVLMANGPTGGNLDDVKRMDTVAISADEVALDAFGATLFGLQPRDVGFVLQGEKAGLGTGDFRALKLEEIGS